MLDKEKKEMDEGDEADDEESEKLERDVEKVEEAMEEEIKGVLKIAKPVHQVFFMLPLHAPFFHASFSCFLFMLLFFFLPFLSSYFIIVIVISCKNFLYSYPSSENLCMQSKNQPQSYYHDGTK